MKLLALSGLLLCALVSVTTAQTTKSPKIFAIQQAAGVILGQMSVFPSVVSDITQGNNVQASVSNGLNAVNIIKSQYTYFDTSYTAAVPTTLRTKLTTYFNNFKTAITSIEKYLGATTISTANLSTALDKAQKELINLGSVVYQL
ncbi:uncharacterized protein LOC128275130 [Anopheles cruzii]|uniref:uncharacterized protein LOC128275130 n=1 Tax=Anopheles cruzii TaxID=68878 RepID=UPI0022EC7575|nr:uncharacterized protein LOC128275130 [Anopheles cruzii]